MRYDPNIDHRRSIRLPAWDYGAHGAYFVTICTYGRECWLEAPSFAAIVLETWNAIPDHFQNTAVDEFVIMPNHVHGVVWITRSPNVGARHDAALPLLAPRRPVVLQFKSAAARQINLARNTPGAPVWQRNYYERVLRDEREVDRARLYILDNPRKWAEDKHNPANLPRPWVIRNPAGGGAS